MMFGRLEPVILPKEAGEYIMKTAKSVSIKTEGVKKVADQVFESLKEGKIKIGGYGDDGFHPTGKETRAVDWIFLLDTLNFCFWTPGNADKWTVNGQTGYMGLVAAIRRASNEGIDISNPQVFSKITEAEMAHICRSDDGVTPIPLLQLRVKCMQEAGTVLIDRYGGTFKTCVADADASGQTLVKILVENFPCFRDDALYDGKRVAFYKRAQILVADLWNCFKGQSWGEFTDIEELAMFADYRVPQVLVHFGALEYSPELMKKLKDDVILENGDREEVEIRGGSIQAVELINIEVKNMIGELYDPNMKTSDINAVMIDYYLWLYRREHAQELEHIPFHKVLSQYY